MPFLERLQSAMILKTPMHQHHEVHIVEPLHAPFYDAIRRGDTEILEQMIDEGFDVDFHEAAHLPPLIYALMFHRLEVLNLLLDRGAHVNAVSNQGMSALHVAIHHRLYQAVYLLLRFGADAALRNRDDQSAFDLADGDPEMLEILHTTQPIAHSGRDCFESAKHGDLYELSRTCNRDQSFFALSPQGHTLLHLAVYANALPMAIYLLNKGLDIDAVDHSGNTPLGIAVKFAHGLEMAALLIRRKATLDHPNAQGRTPLTTALRNGFADIAELLIQSGANIHVVDALHTPLTLVHDAIALFTHQSDAFRALETALLIRGAHVDIPINHLRWTPLFFTISKMQNRAMQEHLGLLIRLGAQINYRDSNGRTPLMIAASLGRLQAVQTLINNYAQLDYLDKFGWSALMLAVYYNHFKIVRLLLETGADANLTSNHLSALKIAKEHQREAIVSLLMEYGAKEERETE